MQTKYLMFKDSVFSVIKKYKKSQDGSSYMPIINYLKQTPPPSKFCCQWLVQLQDSIPLLDKSTEKIVIDTLEIPWQYGEEIIEQHLHNFVVSLVTGHNYYAAPILNCLFKQLTPVINDKNTDEKNASPFSLSKEQQLANYKTLKLIQTVYLHVPLCEAALLKSARAGCPYFQHHSHIHAVFTYNMLLLSHLIPNLRRQILEIIVVNMVKLDLHSPRCELDEDAEDSDNESEDVFSMEVDEEKKPVGEARTTHPVGHRLDTLMTLMLRYIHLTVHGGSKELKELHRILDGSSTAFEVNGCVAGSVVTTTPVGKVPRRNGVESESAPVAVTLGGCGCEGKKQDPAAIKELYLDLKNTFMKIILPTHSTAHAQFLIYYLLALRPSLASDFLDTMKTTFESPSKALEERRNALAFMGSLLARAKFIKFSHIHSCLEIVGGWCKNYLHSEFACANKFEDLRLHNLFYYACQTIFYVFTFNYKEYTESKGRLKLAEALHIDEFVSSPLNPLRYCSQAIAVNIAAVTYHFQLAYCYSVIESNMRLFIPVAMQNSCGVFQDVADTLETYFPFDPYLLKRSSSFILNSYKEFPGLPEEILQHSELMHRKNETDEDNKDMEDILMWNSPQSFKVYDASPGLNGF